MTQHEDADITDLDIARVALKGKAAQEGVRLTPLAFIIKACIVALKEFPRFNASLDAKGENLVLKKYFHIGFAADTPNGLVVPVIRDADRGNLFDIARALAALVGEGARRQADGARNARRLVHRLESGRHRRHGVHPDHQRAGGRHPRRVEVESETGLRQGRVRAAADAAACRCPTIIGSSTAPRRRDSSCS